MGDGTINKVGESYMRNCQRWGAVSFGPADGARATSDLVVATTAGAPVQGAAGRSATVEPAIPTAVEAVPKTRWRVAVGSSGFVRTLTIPTLDTTVPILRNRTLHQ